MGLSEEHDDRTKEEGALPKGPSSISESRSGPPGPRERTCVGCGERVNLGAGAAAEASLVRLILGPGGEVAVDPGDGGFGRGAHVHPRPDCLAKAVQRGLAKAAKGRVTSIASGDGELAPLRADTLAAAIKAAMDRRIEGLLGAAVRSRQVAFGSDSVSGACERGEAALVLVACDAAAAADLAEVRRAIAEGRAVSWGTKLSLGALFLGGEAARPSGVGVVALTSSRIAAAVREAVHIADGVTGRAVAEDRARSDSKSAEPRKKGASGASGSSRSSRASGAKQPVENPGAQAGGSLHVQGAPRHDSRKDSRHDPRKDARKDSRQDLRQDHRGDRKGPRAGKVSLGVAAGAVANRRVDR